MDTELTVIDIKSLVELIDAMAQRGAIRGEELQHMATLRYKLVATVNASIQSQSDENTGTE